MGMGDAPLYDYWAAVSRFVDLICIRCCVSLAFPLWSNPVARKRACACGLRAILARSFFTLDDS